jgi:hypothetical protein
LLDISAAIIFEVRILSIEFDYEFPGQMFAYPIGGWKSDDVTASLATGASEWK